MKVRKIKMINSELRRIKNDFSDEKKRFSIKNKEKIREKSIKLYNFFLGQEKEMRALYFEKEEEKKRLIKKIEQAKEDELFNLFSLDEKINYINIGKRKKII